MAITDGYHCACILDRIINEARNRGDTDAMHDLGSVRSFVIDQHHEILMLHNRITNLKSNFKKAVQSALIVVEEP